MSAKTRSGADYGSDHELTKFRLKLKKVGKTSRPFRYDLNQVPYDYKVEVTNRFNRFNAKEYSNHHTIALISHTSKVMLKILQARHQQYVNLELSDVQAGLRKGRGTRDQILNICWIIEKTTEFQKISTFALLTMPKPLTVWITTNWRVLKEMGILITLPAS